MMFWAGVIAIASPIIIHLLNRRRFKIIDWAAMDFLLLANKKNRRRVKLENLILLLLRCLAVFLLGLMLARPFFANKYNILGEEQQYERIILLDDSLSMNVRNGNSNLFVETKEKLKEFVDRLAQDKSANTLTLVTTSDVDHPVIDNQIVTADRVSEFHDIIDEMTCSHFPSDYENGLRALETMTSGQREGVNRIFYLVTDLRELDWWSVSQSDDGHPSQNLVKDISKNTPLGCFIVDVGSSSESNIAITDIQPQEEMVAGRPCKFAVTVTNFSKDTIKDLGVNFYQSEQAAAVSSVIKEIKPQESETVNFTIGIKVSEADALESNASLANEFEYRRIWAELVTKDNRSDSLELDNVGYYAAKIKRGTSVLLIDGDPSAIEDRAETYHLRRALNPGGPRKTGFLPTVIGISELSSVDYSQFDVIYLCNIDQLSEGQLESLEAWVAEGGSLVLMLGDQINEQDFNKQFYFDPEKAAKVATSKSATETAKMVGGTGLSPVQLTKIKGDVYQSKWVSLDLGETVSPITGIFAGAGNVYQENVMFFSWWGNEQTGFNPVMDPTAPVLTVSNHYKFGKAHRAWKTDSEGEVIEDATYRDFQVSSNGLEVGSEFVISDCLGSFEQYPIRLTADSDAKFSFNDDVKPELILSKLTTAATNDATGFGCWRFRFSSGNTWVVTAEVPANVRDRGENTNVIAKFNDPSSDPAIVEKRFGNGRVVAFMFPADADWTNLPTTGAYLFMQNETCKYLSEASDLAPPKVGDSIRDLVDVSMFKEDVSVEGPMGKKQNIKAAKREGASKRNSKYYEVTLPRMKYGGFYEVGLTEKEKVNGKDVVRKRVFAANVPANLDGGLQRLDLGKVGSNYFGEQTKVIPLADMSSQTIQGAKTEFWKYVLYLLAFVLILEQFLGWYFGKRR